MAENFVRVGKVKDAHGIKGELFIVLFAGEAEWLDQLTAIRLVRDTAETVGGKAQAGSKAAELHGDVQTFAVKSARVHKNGLIVKSSDIKDRNEAEALKGRLFEIPESFLVSEPGEAIYLREVQGFEIFSAGERKGRITTFSSNGAQDLLVVETPEGEFEIPFVEAFVKKIDYGKKTIDMDLPYGLLGEDEADDDQRDGQSDHLAGETDANGETE